MKTEMKNKVLWGLVGLLGLFAIGGSVLAYTGTARIVIENIENATFGSSNEVFGTTETAPTSNTNTDTVTRWDSGFFWGTLEVTGQTYLNGTTTVTRAFTTTVTTTLGFTPNQVNVSATTFNTASTTLCAVQNTSASDRIILNAHLNLSAGSSANTVNSNWRGYVSGQRAQLTNTATGTLFTERAIASSSIPLAFGGPVPGSYYTSSSAAFTGITDITTTTPVIWFKNAYANVTTTAITSSTGSCVFTYIGF